MVFSNLEFVVVFESYETPITSVALEKNRVLILISEEMTHRLTGYVLHQNNSPSSYCIFESNSFCLTL